VSVTNAPNRLGLTRIARLLLCVSALGEITVGVLVLLFPQILAILMGAPLDHFGLLVARMLGSAALALGITWWIARNQPVLHLASRVLAGHLIYNLTVGLLFVLCALAASEPVLPWIIAVGHVLIGVGFAAAVLGAERSEDSAGKSS